MKPVDVIWGGCNDKMPHSANTGFIVDRPPAYGVSIHGFNPSPQVFWMPRFRFLAKIPGIKRIPVWLWCKPCLMTWDEAWSYALKRYSSL